MRMAYKWQAAIVTAIGLFMAVLDNTIVNVALPQMQAYFNTNRDTITWVATGYFLAQAAVIPVVGYVSDRVGSKLVFMVALALFTLGSGMCALAPTETVLIAFRVLQGIGGGALFPIAFAIIFRVFPPQERGPASAVIGVPVLLAPAFGPTIGGYLTSTFDWHAIFLINVPVGVVALTLAYLVLHGRASERAAHDVPATTGRRFDLAGSLLSIAGFTAVVYAISEAGNTSWHNQTVIRFLVAGCVLLVAFIVVELVVPDPVMDVRLFLNYTFAISNLLMWATAAFLFGTLLLLPVFFENVQNLTPLTTGEILILQGVAAAVATVAAGRLYNIAGPRMIVALGFILITLGTYGFTQLTVNATGAGLQGWLILRGLGLGLTMIPLQTLSVSVVSNQAMARASSLVNVMRQVFSAVGVSALTTYFSQQTLHHAATIQSQFLAAQRAHTVPGGVAGVCFRAVGANASLLRACAAQHAMTLGLNDTFVISMIGTAVCVALALIIGRDPALEAVRRARARGEQTQPPQPAMVGE